MRSMVEGPRRRNRRGATAEAFSANAKAAQPPQCFAQRRKDAKGSVRVSVSLRLCVFARNKTACGRDPGLGGQIADDKAD